MASSNLRIRAMYRPWLSLNEISLPSRDKYFAQFSACKGVEDLEQLWILLITEGKNVMFFLMDGLIGPVEKWIQECKTIIDGGKGEQSS